MAITVAQATIRLATQSPLSSHPLSFPPSLSSPLSHVVHPSLLLQQPCTHRSSPLHQSQVQDGSKDSEEKRRGEEIDTDPSDSAHTQTPSSRCT